MKEGGSDNGQASTPHGASLRVLTTASAGGSRARLLCPRYGLPPPHEIRLDYAVELRVVMGKN